MRTAATTRPRSAAGACRKISTSSRTRTEAVAGAMLDQFRERFFAAHQAGRLPARDVPAGESYRKGILAIHETRVLAATAAKIRDGLQSLVDDVEAASAEGAAEGGIPIDVLLGSYSPAEQGG